MLVRILDRRMLFAHRAIGSACSWLAPKPATSLTWSRSNGGELTDIVVMPVVDGPPHARRSGSVPELRPACWVSKLASSTLRSVRVHPVCRQDPAWRQARLVMMPAGGSARTSAAWWRTTMREFERDWTVPPGERILAETLAERG
jgi:hypothetical protein